MKSLDEIEEGKKAKGLNIAGISDTLLKKASNITQGSYGKLNSMRDYSYLRISQKEPLDILYFTRQLHGYITSVTEEFKEVIEKHAIT